MKSSMKALATFISSINKYFKVHWFGKFPRLFDTYSEAC